MKTCRTCKWWGKDDPGCCGKVDTIVSSNPETELSIEASADDDSGLWARLRTGPDFGCVLHEEKLPGDQWTTTGTGIEWTTPPLDVFPSS